MPKPLEISAIFGRDPESFENFFRVPYYAVIRLWVGTEI
jgi:hypothetical protein